MHVQIKGRSAAGNPFTAKMLEPGGAKCLRSGLTRTSGTQNHPYGPCLDREDDGTVKTLVTAEQRGCLPCGTSVYSLCSQAPTKSLPAARSNHCTWRPHLTQLTPHKTEARRRPPPRAGPCPSARKPHDARKQLPHKRMLGNTVGRDHSELGQAF